MAWTDSLCSGVFLSLLIIASNLYLNLVAGTLDNWFLVSWTSHLIFLGLSCHNCQMGMLIILSLLRGKRVRAAAVAII